MSKSDELDRSKAWRRITSRRAFSNRRSLRSVPLFAYITSTSSLSLSYADERARARGGINQSRSWCATTICRSATAAHSDEATASTNALQQPKGLFLLQSSQDQHQVS